jgi:hypothetical protein
MRTTTAIVPANLRLHCVCPAVSHLFYCRYLAEEDGVKRDQMLEINWTMKGKMQRDKEKKRDDKIKKEKIIKYSKEPQYVEEEIDGKLVMHNKPLEELIREEQPIQEFQILWREDGICFDIATSE